MEGRGALFFWAGLKESLHAGDYARVTIRVGMPLLVPLIQMMLAVLVRVSMSCLELRGT